MPVHWAKTFLGILVLASAGACSPQEPEEYGIDGFCEGGHRNFTNGLARYERTTLQWTPDGSQILFDYGDNRIDLPPADYGAYQALLPDASDVYAVNASGYPVKELVDLPTRNFRYSTGEETPFDLSADGTRIVYAACAFSEEAVVLEEGERQVLNYEIFVSNFDGGKKTRLTNNTYMDFNPAWSPDGGNIAFISDPDRSVLQGGITEFEDGREIELEATIRITIHQVATGENREIGLPKGLAAAPIRLEWSPKGDRIAFVVLEGEQHPWNLAVYTVGADGSGLTRISDARSGPAWSPDGEALAMMVEPGSQGEEVLCIFAADGSDLVGKGYRLAELYDKMSNKLGRVRRWMGNLTWSSDGRRILFENLHGPDSVVQLGTASVESCGALGAPDSRSGAMPSGNGTRGFILASPLPYMVEYARNRAWSPDGTQLAVRRDSYAGFELLVVDRQGNSRTLLEWSR